MAQPVSIVLTEESISRHGRMEVNDSRHPVLDRALSRTHDESPAQSAELNEQMHQQAQKLGAVLETRTVRPEVDQALAQLKTRRGEYPEVLRRGDAGTFFSIFSEYWMHLGAMGAGVFLKGAADNLLKWAKLSNGRKIEVRIGNEVVRVANRKDLDDAVKLLSKMKASHENAVPKSKRSRPKAKRPVPKAKARAPSRKRAASKLSKSPRRKAKK